MYCENLCYCPYMCVCVCVSVGESGLGAKIYILYVCICFQLFSFYTLLLVNLIERISKSNPFTVLIFSL